MAKLAAIAFLAPMAVSAMINLCFAKDSKEAFQYAAFSNPISFSGFTAYKKPSNFKNPIFWAINTIIATGSYCLYKAMQTKSPYFIIPAAILTTASIALGAGVSAQR